MTGRLLVSLLMLGLLAAPLAAEAQPVRKVAFLCPRTCSNLPNPTSDWDRAFLAGLERAGYVLGQNASIDMSGVSVGYTRLPDAAKKLLKRNVDVIVAFGNAATRAASQATNSTSIVMLNVVDAVEDGLIGSLSRPGGNVTGLSIPSGQIAAKRIELLKEINPRLARVAVLQDPQVGFDRERFARLERATRSLGVKLFPVAVASIRDLENAFSSMGPERPDGLLLFEELWLGGGAARGEIVVLALQRRMATAGSDRYFVEGGGLLAYGPFQPDLYERAALYVGKLLKGARPSEVPVEEPTRFELTVNNGTARALGLTIPAPLLARADQVIQ